MTPLSFLSCQSCLLDDGIGVIATPTTITINISTATVNTTTVITPSTTASASTATATAPFTTTAISPVLRLLLLEYSLLGKWLISQQQVNSMTKLSKVCMYVCMYESCLTKLTKKKN